MLSRHSGFLFHVVTLTLLERAVTRDLLSTEYGKIQKIADRLGVSRVDQAAASDTFLREFVNTPPSFGEIARHNQGRLAALFWQHWKPPTIVLCGVRSYRRSFSLTSYSQFLETRALS